MIIFKYINPVFLAVNFWSITAPRSKALQRQVFWQSAGALRLCRWPHPASHRRQPVGTGAGAAERRAGKWHGRWVHCGKAQHPCQVPATPAADSEQAMPFSVSFWPGGGLGAGLWGCAPPALLKITAKYVLFLSLCQWWEYFWSDERVSWRCRGSCGDTCALTGAHPQLFPVAGHSSSILMSKAQPHAGCNPPP